MSRIETIGGRSAARRGGLVLVCLASLAPPGVARLGSPAPRGARGGDGVAAQPATRADVDAFTLCEVLSVLAPAAPARPSGDDSRPARVAALGRKAIPVVVGLLSGELLAPEVLGAACGEEVAQRAAGQPLEALLRASLRGFEPDPLARWLGQRASSELPLDERLFAADLLGRVEGELACSELLAIVRGLDPMLLTRTRASQVLEQALGAQLLRDPALLARVAQDVQDLEPHALGVVARAVGGLEDARAIELLGRWLGREAELDAVILGEMDRCVPRGQASVSESTRQQLRSVLTRSLDQRVLAGAATVLGRLRDLPSYPQLVALLERDDHIAAAAARWGLERIAGIDLGERSSDWLEWHSAEEAWWSESAPDLLAKLGDESPSVVHEALAALVQHPLYRERICEAVGPLLLHADLGVARAACASLDRLQASAALPWLVDGLLGPDDGRRELARGTLCRMTGLDLPVNANAWTGALLP